MKKNCLIAACAGLAMASVALASPPAGKLQAIGGTRVDPIEVASIRDIGHGRVALTSPWVAYHSNLPPQTSEEQYIFDCYDGDSDGAPAGHCEGIPDGSRWFFGTGYLNPLTAEDMTNSAGFNGATMDGCNITWHWGQGASRPMYVAILFYEEMINDIDCSVDTFQDTGIGGVILHYADSAGAAGYYYSPVDSLIADGLEIVMPSGTSGSYIQVLARDFDGTTLTLDDVLGTQSMLWGCSNNGGTAGRVGEQFEQTLQDDNPTDGKLTGDECYSLDYAGYCPEPFGACNGFLVLGGCTGNADYNRDGFITGEDFDQFVQDFEAGGCEDGTGSGCRGATDYNGDGFQTGEDFDLFVQDYEAGCQ